MRRGSCKLGLVVIFGVMMVFGCGGGGIEEMGQRYTASLEVEDVSGATLAIDVCQDMCDDEWEEFGPAIGQITVGVAVGSPGITLKNYTIDYIPLPSPDGTSQTLPPRLESPLPGLHSIDIGPGGSASFSLTLMSVDTKQEFIFKAGWIYVDDYPDWLAAVDAVEFEIAEKQKEIDAKNIEMDDKKIEIIRASEEQKPALEQDLEVLQIELDRLLAQMDALESQLAALQEMPIRQGWIPRPPLTSRYTMRVTLNFEDTFGKDRTLVIDRTIWLYNVNNC
jgi:hypothetical protein